MHFLLFATLTGTVLAESYLGQFPNALQARQGGDAFIPTTGDTVFNCPAPCGTHCLELSRGDTCCVEGYGCPGKSFCLTKGYCCPEGDDPATCARKNGITLPSGFQAGNTVAPGTASSTPAATTPTQVSISTPPPAATAPTQVSVSTPPPPAATTPTQVSISTPPPTAATSSPAPPLSANPSNSTVPAATAQTTSTGTSPSTSVVSFTGGASSIRFAAEGGIAAVLVAAAGAFGLLL